MLLLCGGENSLLKTKKLKNIIDTEYIMKRNSSNGKALTKKTYYYPKKDFYPKLKGEELSKAINEAHKDMGFMAEVRKFIKITTS